MKILLSQGLKYGLNNGKGLGYAFFQGRKYSTQPEKPSWDNLNTQKWLTEKIESLRKDHKTWIDLGGQTEEERLASAAKKISTDTSPDGLLDQYLQLRDEVKIYEKRVYKWAKDQDNVFKKKEEFEKKMQPVFGTLSYAIGLVVCTIVWIKFQNVINDFLDR